MSKWCIIVAIILCLSLFQPIAWAHGYDIYCMACGASLWPQKGFNPDLPYWICTNCGGYILMNDTYSGERFPDSLWFCDRCGDLMNAQPDFSDLNDIWKCTNCGYVNAITEENTLDPYTNGTNQSSANLIGQSIFFGHYEQDNQLLNGTEPIEWICLAQGTFENKEIALLVSKYILDVKPYHSTNENITWKNSSIRTWLNKDFVNLAFTPAEKELIDTDFNYNNDVTTNPAWNTTGGDDTEDSVFLLSYSEITNYLSDYAAEPTPFAKSQQNFKTFSWWSRSPGLSQNRACCFNSQVCNSIISYLNGIRPAIYVRMDLSPSEPLPYDQLTSATQYLNENSDIDEKKTEELAIICETLGNFHGAHILSAFLRLNCMMKYYQQGLYTEALNQYQLGQSIVDNYGFTWTYASEYFGLTDNKVTDEMLYAIAEYCKAQAAQIDNKTDNNSACTSRTDLPAEVITTSESSAYPAIESTAFSVNKDTGKIFHKRPDPVITNATYTEPKKIGDNDRHKNWWLGQFVICNSDWHYDEVYDEGRMPVFVVTQDHIPKLTFELQQDINCLGGNKDFVIDNDQSGSDKHFDIEKTKEGFGHGTLIIRHKSPTKQNGESVDHYTDYLNAKSSVNANTELNLSEEGVYEVALDYAVRDNNWRSSFDKIHYYQISFKFAVELDDNMFFLQDLKSSSILSDYSATKNGFRIYNCSGESWKINYELWKLNTNKTALDLERKSVAFDGDEFREIGLYVITASNRQTGEKIIKHIFVGSSMGLSMFKQVDERMNPFTE